MLYCRLYSVLYYRLNQEMSSKRELLHCTFTKSIYGHLYLEEFSVERVPRSWYGLIIAEQRLFGS
jgi:hypothetical protein